jgi:hypothetical protein
MPKILSALGRVLSKRKDKKNDQNIVSPERKTLLDRVATLRDNVAALPFPALKAQLVDSLANVEKIESTLDAVTDISARSAKLMQLIGAVDGLEAKAEQVGALTDGHRELSALLLRLRRDLAAVTGDEDRSRIETKLGTLERGMGLAVASTNPKDLEALKALLVPARAMKLDLDGVLAREVAQRKVASEWPPMKLRASMAKGFDNSSPTMKSRLLVLTGLETELERAIAAKEDLAAAGQLPALSRALEQVEAQEKEEAKAYADGLQAAKDLHATLSAPVVSVSAGQFKTAYVDEPPRLAAAGKRFEATAQLAKAVAAQVPIAAHITEYTDALAAAKLALNNAKPNMVPLDISKVETELIAAAETEAGKGMRAEALALLAKVAPHCKISEQANLKAFRLRGQFSSAMLLEPLVSLKAHASAGEFKLEIGMLERRVDRANRLLATGLTTRKAVVGTPGAHNDSFAEKEMLQVHLAAKKVLAQAGEHLAYIGKREACELKIKQLREAEPKASNAVLTEQLAALDAGLLKAGNQCKKRVFDLADNTLKKLDTDIDAASAIKTAHGSYVTELARLTLRVSDAKDEPGTPSAAEALDLRTLLAQAKALADNQRDYAGANKLLARLSSDCDTADANESEAVKHREAATQALAGLEDSPATALAQVRQLLAALKVRPGHEGIASQIGAIENLLTQADTALKA